MIYSHDDLKRAVRDVLVYMAHRVSDTCEVLGDAVQVLEDAARSPNNILDCAAQYRASKEPK